ncbi:ATP-binding cassette sub-family C member 4-like [Takifugu flavidus]|uniref:ATP-binding cassette sub-family C member 4-like n=1 Tax=Takifugu flavidus TaxID=433684 RepID=UPI0025449E07|nr:ATP-binding cassette sub-family C member 4-like [Takifugu flavidus]
MVRKLGGRDNPLAAAGFFSKLCLCWLNPLLNLSQKRMLEENDMYNILPEDQSETVGEELQRLWDCESKKATKELKKPSLSRVLLRCYGKAYAMTGLFVFSLEAIKVFQPLLLWNIIHYFENYDPEDQKGLTMAYVYASALSLSAFGLTILQHLYYYTVLRLGMKIRVALCHMIYRKALALSSESMGLTTTGQIVNLLANDVNHFDEITLELHYLWLGPLQALVIIILLWYEVGLSCLAGLGAIVIMLPLQTWFGKLFGIFRSKSATLADKRIRIMNEVLSGIRIIKMYAWEKPFSALVTEVRRKEISQIMKSSYLRGLNMASFFASSKIIVFVTFTVYVLLGNAITASTVFVTVSLYGTIKLTVTLFFPLAVERLSETAVSIRRIKNFLLLGEVKSRNTWHPLDETKTSEGLIKMENVTCFWDKCMDAPSLRNISITVGPQQLLAVIGPVGAGKSSLLSAILGELPHDSGILQAKGRVTYAAQQPWVFPGTIRSNILFGRELNPNKYETVLKACALKRDLDLLPSGDLTLIGDRGATLSGGQKARVNLARAVYEDADIYLLDDPLSAVDAEVGKHLFEQCICGLLKDKCRILVTHQLQHLRAANHILLLQEGHIVTQGTYRDFQRSGLDVASLMRSDEEQDKYSQIADLEKQSIHSQKTTCSFGSLLPPDCSDTEEPPAETVLTMSEETRVEGNVSLHIYYKYFTAGCNTLVLMLILLLSVIAEVAYILQDWWLVHWAKEELYNSTASVAGTDINVTPSHQFNLTFYLSIYSGLTAAAVVFGYTRCFLIFHKLVRSAQHLHDSMFHAIIRTSVHFFDVNPIGRILNRFSKDIGLMDSKLPITFVDFYQLFLQNVGVVAVAASIIPVMLVPILPLLLFFLYLRRFYLSTSRDVKRLEATTRSPIFSHLSSSLQGLWTIRAFGAQERQKHAFDAHQDLHSEAWFLFLMTSRWFAFRLDSICSVFITLASFGCILFRNGLEAGEVGLVLTYAVTLVGNLQWTMRQSAEVENMMTSVERVVEYTEVKSEASWNSQQEPPPDWPNKGQVTFSHVNMSYSPNGPLVLKDISFTLQPSEKVGVVGRTGAGKSSLVSALFRLVEPEGNIFIDGVQTSKIGLHQLRQKMSIIPQDPVLFTDTLRKNLDPFNKHNNEDLWNALEEVQLRSVVEDLPGKLETVLAESGSNFSVGQRQLVCLARALLRKNRILIIDEATANVDPRTDELIQKTIRDKFRECTVLTIAHRLNTIIDSDRILVLDNGSIQEFDRPLSLLQIDGALNKIVQQLGPAEAAALLEAAKQAAQRGNGDDLSTM